MAYKDPEQNRKYSRQYHATHRKAAREYAKQYRADRPEKMLEDNKRRYTIHREEELERVKQYRKDNSKKVRECRRQRARRLKKKIISEYGGACIICGESHIECLTIDHANGDGAQFRQKMANKSGRRYSFGGQTFYLWLEKQNYPRDLGLRVLCWNCNCSIGMYGYSPLGMKPICTDFRDSDNQSGRETGIIER